MWSDCLGVVNNLLLLFRGKARIRPNASNSDLWYWIQRSWVELGQHRVRVGKVAAHRDVRRASTRREAWLCWNNDAADRAGNRMANHSRPSFWAWSQHATASQLGSCMMKQLHPPKQTWNLKMDPWKRRFLLETIISRFHVNFWGCSLQLAVAEFFCTRKSATSPDDLPDLPRNDKAGFSPSTKMQLGIVFHA